MMDKQSIATSYDQLARLLRHGSNDVLEFSKWSEELLEQVLHIPSAAILDTRSKNLSKSYSQEIETNENASSTELNQQMEKGWHQRLVQLIQANAPWYEIKKTGWYWYKSLPDVSKAGRLIELSCIHQESKDLMEFLNVFAIQYQHSLLGSINQKVRTQILTFLDSARRTEIIDHLYPFKKNNLPNLINYKLSMIDRAILLDHLILNDQPKDQSKILFDVFNAQLIVDLMSYATALKVLQKNADERFLILGRHALKYCDDISAWKCLSQINPDSGYYFETLELARNLRKNTHESKTKSLYYRVQKKPLAKRLKIIAHALQDIVNTQDGYNLEQCSEIDAVFRSIFDLLNHDVEHYQKLGNIIVKFRHSVSLVPSLFQPVIDMSLEFDCSINLFKPFLEIDYPKTGYEHYLKGVALLHQYALLSSEEHQGLLVRAKRHLEICDKINQIPGFHSWSKCHGALLKHTSLKRDLLESSRQQLLIHLRVHGAEDSVTFDMIQDYVDMSDVKEESVIDHLLSFRISKKDKQLLSKLLIQRSRFGNSSTQLLFQLWQVAAEAGCYDLGWRIGTVLDVRGHLPKQMKCAWQVSGECRNHYAATTLALGDFDVALSDMSVNFKKIIYGLLTTSSPLIEYMLLAFPGLSKSKISQIYQSNLQGQAISMLENQEDVINVPKYKISTTSKSNLLGFNFTNPTMSFVPDRLWAHLVIVLEECLGSYIFNWKLSELKSLTSHFPVGGHRNKKFTIRYVRWYKNLSPAQKEFWQNIPHYADKMTDQSFLNDSLQFVSRLATMIYPNHREALSVVRSMKIDKEEITRFESWLIGSEYSAYREKHDLDSKVPIPSILKSIEAAS